MDNFNRNENALFSMEVDDEIKTSFIEMARWTKFLSILGFVSLFLMIVGGFAVGAALNNMSGAASPLAGIGAVGLGTMYALIAAINVYPIYALLKYSTGIKSAMLTNDRAKFSIAVTYLKNMFKYIGVLAIIGLCLYGLAIIAVIIGAASKM